MLRCVLLISKSHMYAIKPLEARGGGKPNYNEWIVWAAR